VLHPLPPDPDLVSKEEELLASWAANDIFTRSVAARRDAPSWIFFEGPPTANGRPGLHHVWARVYKDLFCRYKTMQGFLVERRAGWDTHGLPVEVEVEKRLGVTGKRQIEEEVGIAEFTRLCKESVLGYVEDWKRLTERIGYWTDLDAAYWTFDRSYVDSVWWQLQQLFDKGLLYEGLKGLPYCPRCGTALSSHELGQPDVYRDEEDESAYVAFRIVNPTAKLLSGAHSLVVWTTTPWTLLSNSGVAVNPDLTYVVVDGLIVAEALVDAVFGEGAKVSGRIKGATLVGLRYERPFDDVSLDGPSVMPGRVGESVAESGWRVVGASFVTTEDGTGLVHLAPAFGEIDRVVGQENGLPTLNPMGPDGCFTDAVAWLSGRAVRDTNSEINDALAAKGLLVRRHPYVHSYPHCWRCQTPLIYWGKPSWYIATSSKKDALVAANQTVTWHPSHIRDGRFGEWLENNVDWALSRDRYWGTPLPIWRCEHGHLTCIGSMAELEKLCGRDLSDVDVHRPAIDEITFSCPHCEGEDKKVAHRVAPVIDAWFDSGSMPAAQVGYPHVAGSREAFVLPADFVTEAIDQTRGWFYSLLAVNTLVFGEAPYRHVMCLGHIVDAQGKKMSKSIGNVIDPWEVLSTRGADALRWWMFSQGSPWTPTRVSLAAIDTALRDTISTLWNTASFFTTYATLNNFDPNDKEIPAPKNRPAMDRWALSRLNSTVKAVTAALDAYEPLDGATALAELVDDLSNWYVRRSRRRFWRTDPDAPQSDSLAAQATLYEALTTLSKLFAPLCPFLAERLGFALGIVEQGDSIHLADWPHAREETVDAELEEQMALSRRLSSLGRAARAEAGVKVRQPLGRALVFLAPGASDLLPGIVEDELNVDEVVVAKELGEVLAFELVPNFKTLGPRLGEGAKELRPALARLDAAAAAKDLEEGRSIEIVLGGEVVKLSPHDVDLRVRGQAGFAVSREGAEVVALDTNLNDDLRQRGLAREVIRHLQELRKSTGLDLSDRIEVHLLGGEALGELHATVAREVLATRIEMSEGTGVGTPLEIEEHPGLVAWIRKVPS
jgi:isoleucyl-tRNA synthetase